MKMYELRVGTTALFVAMLAFGCTRDAVETPDPAATAKSADSSAAPPGADSAIEHTDSGRLALDPGGLRIFMTSNGSARAIPFGTAMAQTVDVVRRVHGAPVNETRSEDCNADVATFPDNLVLYFTNDEFVGWSVRDGSTLTTAYGIGTGMTRAQLDSGYVAEVKQTSLGTEFTAGMLAGLLESPASGARITHLWSGATCIAR